MTRLRCWRTIPGLLDEVLMMSRVRYTRENGKIRLLYSDIFRAWSKGADFVINSPDVGLRHLRPYTLAM